MPSLTTVIPLLLSIIACVLVCRLDLADAAADTSDKYHWCNTKALPISSDEVRYIDEIRQYAVHQTPNLGFNSYLTYQGYFARASCRTPISPVDCILCLGYADNKLYQLCNLTVGAQITQADCRLRFEQYYFDDNW